MSSKRWPIDAARRSLTERLGHPFTTSCLLAHQSRFRDGRARTSHAQLVRSIALRTWDASRLLKHGLEVGACIRRQTASLDD